MSLRACGEGHISSIEFRTGTGYAFDVDGDPTAARLLPRWTGGRPRLRRRGGGDHRGDLRPARARPLGADAGRRLGDRHRRLHDRRDWRVVNGTAMAAYSVCPERRYTQQNEQRF